MTDIIVVVGGMMAMYAIGFGTGACYGYYFNKQDKTPPQLEKP